MYTESLSKHVWENGKYFRQASTVQLQSSPFQSHGTVHRKQISLEAQMCFRLSFPSSFGGKHVAPFKSQALRATASATSVGLVPWHEVVSTRWAKPRTAARLLLPLNATLTWQRHCQGSHCYCLPQLGQHAQTTDPHQTRAVASHRLQLPKPRPQYGYRAGIKNWCDVGSHKWSSQCWKRDCWQKH